jgi:HlyD family type I secretion membrane fusion protein
MSGPFGKDEDPFGEVATSPKGVTGRPGKFMMAALVVVTAWAFLVPLSSAVIAPATLVSSANNQLLQHISGGVVTAIRASAGDMIDQGRVILELDPAIDQARLTKLRGRHAVLSALRKRLEAEKASDPFDPVPSVNLSTMTLRGSDGLDFNLTASLGETQIEQALNAEQVRELTKGRLAIGAQLRGLSDRSVGQQQRLRALASQIRAAERRTDLLRDQLANARALVAAGHLARQQAWEIEMRLLDSETGLSDLRSEMTTVQSSIGETEAEMERIKMSDGEETSQQLTDVLAELEQISDELAAAERSRENAALKAPVRGQLVHFTATTVGGVVKPGETIGEIVPADAPLEVRARVRVNQISAVHVGQTAELRISALNPRIYDPLPARISHVAADASQDQQTGEHFFEVRAIVDEGAAREMGASLLPGMAGEIFIAGESRTFATYMLQPILDGLAHTFREVH